MGVVPGPGAIDCWLNPTLGLTDYRPEFLVRVAREYFRREREMFEPTPIEELLQQMDTAGIERAILTMNAHDPEPVAAIARAFPGRFICSAVIDPTTGMEALRLVERLVADGLIDRRAAPKDRRSQIVSLTTEGRRAFRAMARTHENWIAEIFGELSASDIDMLMKMLAKAKTSTADAIKAEKDR